MRVCLDTSTLRVQHAGIATYTLQLVESLLARLGPGEDLVSFDAVRGFVPIDADWPELMHAENEARSNGRTSAAPDALRCLENVMRAGSRRRRLARFVKEARFMLGSRHYDVCHAVVTLPPGRTTKPVIPLIHDLSTLRYPETHPPERVRAFERWWPEIMQAPLINTVSVFSREEIVRLLGYPRKQIVVTQPGVDPFFFDTGAAQDEAALERLELHGRRAILAVGTQEPRKNLGIVLAAFAALPAKVRAGAVLVVAGGRGWGQQSIPVMAQALVRNGDIRFTGYVTKLQLRALYRRASLLVFPSLYEGFGIPAAEALTCGTRVAFSTGSSLDEVVGPHGTGIQSGDVDGWRAVMHEALEEPEATLSVRAARHDWARRFDWQTTAAQTILMYRAVLSGKPMAGSAPAISSSW